MAAFEYTALDAKGRPKSGVLSAANERAARQELMRRKLAPVKLAPAGPSLTKAAAQAQKPGLFQPKFGSRTLTLVTRQLATLLTVTPVEEALRTLALQAENAAARRTLLAVHAGVLEGYRLSDAMSREGAAFPPLYRAMVAAGEASGALPEILERLADLLEKEQETRAKVTTALVYPAALAVTAVLVLVALMTFVVPRVVEQFDSIGQDLPPLTQAVIFVSDAFRIAGPYALGVLALLLLLFLQAIKAQPFKARVDALALKLPLFGRLARDLHAARLSRTLSTMIAGGLPLLEGLTITARTVRNERLKAATTNMVDAIREGGGLAASMRRENIFPPILIYLTASGEESGRLDVMLGRAADYLDREVNTVVAAGLALLEPVIIILMAVVVTTIVMAILLPILQINTLAFS